MDSFAHDMLLLMTNLTQMKDEQRVLSLFQEALNSISTEFSLEFSEVEPSSGDYIDIVTTTRKFGYFIFSGVPEAVSAEFPALLANSVQILGIVLEKLHNDKLLQDEKSLLREKINEKTQSLLESDERFKRLTENSPDIIYRMTLPEGRYEYVSPAAEVLTGYSPEEWYQTDAIIRKLIHPDWQEYLEEEWTKLIHGEMSPSYEYQVVHRNGLIRWFNQRNVLITNGNGSPVAIEGIVTDVTTQKQVEEALTGREERYRALIDAMPDVVIRFDEDGRHVFVSENITEAFSVPAHRYVGKTHDELGFSAEHCWFWQEAIQKVVTSSKPVEAEYTFNGADKMKNFNLRFFPECNEQGAVISVLAICRDITLHRQLEKNYKALFREMLDGFALHEIIYNGDGSPVDYRFLAVNPAFEKMTGLRGKDIIGKTVKTVIPGIEDHWIDTYGRVASTGEPAFFEEYAGGLDKHFEVTAYRPAAGQFACIFSDITERIKIAEERQRLEEQLYQAQKMESIGRLAGGVAHDFNNMLSAILGNVELVMNEFDESDPSYEDLLEIKKAATRSTDLTKQLLGFARKQTVALKVFNLNDVISGLLKMLKRLIGENIELVWKPGETTWQIRIDPSQIDQIMTNMMVNARDAITDVGIITIETREAIIDEKFALSHPGMETGEYVLLSIQDNGGGMTEETLANLFDPFYTTKPAGKGTGLGLATVYGIVKQNQGYIGVDSVVGQGTCFNIYLPRHRGKSIEAITVNKTETVIQGEETVLFVEDEPSILSLGAKMLKSLGYNVLTAGRPREAIELASKYGGEIHLLITDVIMPEMNGKEMANQIQTFYPNLKRLFISGYTADVIAHNGVLEEGTCFVQKPFSVKTLSSKVRAALESQAPR